jgi:hypothetical protein
MPTHGGLLRQCDSPAVWKKNLAPGFHGRKIHSCYPLQRGRELWIAAVRTRLRTVTASWSMSILAAANRGRARRGIIPELGESSPGQAMIETVRMHGVPDTTAPVRCCLSSL